MDRAELQAPHPLFQALDVEIEQQAYWNSRVAEIGSKLREMNRQQVINGLQFEKHFPLDDDVGPIASRDQVAIEPDPDGKFAFDTKAITCEAMHQACPVRTFQQSRAQPGVYIECAAEYSSSEFALYRIHFRITVGRLVPMTLPAGSYSPPLPPTRSSRPLSSCK